MKGTCGSTRTSANKEDGRQANARTESRSVRIYKERGGIVRLVQGVGPQAQSCRSIISREGLPHLQYKIFQPSFPSERG